MSVETLESQVHRISVQEYQRLAEAGVLDEDARIELIDGLIVDMGPKTRGHENAIAWLARLLFGGLNQERFEVRIGAPLSLETSEPEPDIIVIDRSVPRPYHPATAGLVIEVAVSSQTRDLRHKPPLYARAGVPEYWVVDLDRGRAVTHSAPHAGAYAEVAVVGADGELAAPHVGLARLAVADVLRAAAA